MVGVLEEPGEDLHHAGIERALLGRERAPVLHVGVATREHRVPGNDPLLLLPCEDLLAIGVPAVVELALVPVGPLLGHVMRRVLGTGRELQEEGLARRERLGVLDELDGAVHQVLGQVVPLLRRPRRLDLVVVVDGVGVVLARVAPRKP
jgi:hypothetical protein